MIVKRYRSERGTETIDQLLSSGPPQDRFYTSFLTVLELTSAVMRLAKGRQLAESAATEILSMFHLDLRDKLRVWPVDDEIMRSAVRVVEEQMIVDVIPAQAGIQVESMDSGSSPE